jgi:hypothetical protein
LGIITLGFLLIVCGLTIAQYAMNFSQYLNPHYIVHSFGSIAIMFGSLARFAAFVIFLSAYLNNIRRPLQHECIESEPGTSVTG